MSWRVNQLFQSADCSKAVAIYLLKERVSIILKKSWHHHRKHIWFFYTTVCGNDPRYTSLFDSPSVSPKSAFNLLKTLILSEAKQKWSMGIIFWKRILKHSVLIWRGEVCFPTQLCMTFDMTFDFLLLSKENKREHL